VCDETRVKPRTTKTTPAALRTEEGMETRCCGRMAACSIMFRSTVEPDDSKKEAGRIDIDTFERRPYFHFHSELVNLTGILLTAACMLVCLYFCLVNVPRTALA